MSLVGENGGTIRLVVDTDPGITLGQCMDLNRALSAALEAHMGDAYDAALEVASPGVGEPLRLHRQYTKNVGRKVKIRLKDGQSLQGELLQVSTDKLELGVVTKYNPKSPHPPSLTPRTLALDELEETKVIIDYTP